ncbi:MAG: PorT family protein [Cyclobacteriaceae bacterium]|nr:PorT family protein [Cyclobacteriaceae bacterium]
MTNRLLFAIVIQCSLYGLSYNTSLAQTFGFRLGPNLATQQMKQGRLMLKPGYIVRLHAGAFVNSDIGENFCFQVEVGYSGLGHQGVYANNLNSSNYHYGTAGVIFKYYPNKKVSFLAGPQLGYLLGGKTSAGQNVSDLPPDREDLNAVIGAEFYPTQLIGVGLRYNYGITSLDVLSDNTKIYNRAIQLSLIFRIPGYQLKESGY